MGQHVRTVSPLQPLDPATLGGHTLLGRLGAGGMGVVYLAEGSLGLVAIKVVRDELANDKDFRTRFQREVRACFLVSGPWTARLLDFDITASPPWLATEFIDAPDLQEVVDTGGPFSPRDQTALALALARGLATLHSRNLVHRDLKPSNVLYPPEGPKIIDFGIASAIEDIGSLTATNNVVGSPAWMAPEQIVNGESGMASDVYAWGALVVFSATGRPLVNGRNMHQIMTNALSLDIKGSVDKVDTSLQYTVAAALATDPSERPTAAQIAQLLAPVEEPTRPVPIPIPPKPVPPPASRKGKILLSAAAAGILVLGGLTAILMSASSSDKHHAASAPSPPTASKSSLATAGPIQDSASPASASSAPPAATGAPFRPILTQAQLMSRIPASVRPTCTDEPPNSRETSRAICRFDFPGGRSTNVIYTGFKTSADLVSDVDSGDKVPNGCVTGLNKFISGNRDGGYQHPYADGSHSGQVNCRFSYDPDKSLRYSDISWSDTGLGLEGFMSADEPSEAAYEALYKDWLQVRQAS